MSDSAEHGRVFRAARMLGLILAWITGVLLVLTVAMVLAVVHTALGTRTAIRIGVSIYADMIPGDAAVDGVAGSLGSGLTLRGVVLRDRLGATLISAETLELDMSPWSLLTKHVDVQTLTLRKARVHLPGDPNVGGFGDLAPVRDPSKPEPPPTPGLGPDLPVRISGVVVIEDFALTANDEPLVIVSNLSVEVDGQGQNARARVHGDASVPRPGLQVDALDLAVAWQDPEVTELSFTLDSNWGRVALGHAEADLARPAVTVEGLEVAVAPAQWTTWTGLAGDLAPQLTAGGQGSPEGVDVDATARMGTAARLTLGLDGVVTPDWDLRATVEATGRPDRLIPEAPEREAQLQGTVELRGAVDRRVEATAELTCAHCLDPDEPLGLSASVNAVPVGAESWSVLLAAKLGFRSTQITAEGVALPGNLVGGKVDLVGVDLAELFAAAAQFVELPSVRGQVKGMVACVGVMDGPVATCRTELGLDAGDPVREARLAATVSTSGPGRLTAEVAKLRVALEPIDVRLVGDPTGADVARVELTPGKLMVTGLDLLAATKTGQGRVRVEGVLEDGSRASLTAQVSDLDLGALAAVVPSAGLAGHLQADAELSGSLAEPRARAEVRVRRLVAAGISVGNVALEGAYGDGRVTAKLGIDGGQVGTWRFDGAVPVSASLSPRAFALGDGALEANLDVDDVQLATLAAARPELADARGDLDVRLKVGGRASRPTAELEAGAANLALGEQALGDLSLRGAYDGREAQVDVSLVHPRVTSLRVEAKTAVALSLLATPKWYGRASDHVELTVAGAQLGWVEDFTEVPVAGTLDGSITLDGPARAPRARVDLNVQGLAYAGEAVADVTVEASYGDGRLDVNANANGPVFAALELGGSTAIDVGATRGRVHWRADEPLELALSLSGLDLFKATQWLPEPPDVAGIVDVTADLTGTGRAPKLDVRLGAHGVAYGGAGLGEAVLEADYDAGELGAELRWVQDPDHLVTLEARAPVTVDLPAGAVQWQSAGVHHLAVDVPRIDPEFLSPWVEVPDDLDFATALRVHADGHADDLEFTASLSGHGRSPGLAPVPIRVELRADEVQQRLNAKVGDSFTARGETGLALGPLSRGEVALTDGTVNARVRWVDGSAALVSELLPTHVYDARGALNLDATVVGTLGAPKLAGQASLTKGAATVVDLRQRFEDVSVGVDFDRDRITLRELKLRANRGTLSGKGEVRFDGPNIEGELGVALDRLPLQRPGLPRLEVTSQIDVDVVVAEEKATVDVGLRDSRVDVVSGNVAAAKPIPRSPNVVVVTRLDAPAARVTAAEPEEAEPGMAIDLAVALADPLRIRGPAIDLSWTGKVAARTTDGEVVTSGQLEASEGFFELLSNQFVLRRGIVTLPPSTDAQLFIDLVAETTVEEYVVTATLRGDVLRPELRLSSTPSLSESQIFTLLLTGSANFDEVDTDSVEAQAASLLAAVSSPVLQRQLNDKLHVDRIGVGVGETTREPILSVGKYITRRLYAETKYHHNAPPDQNSAELRVRYRFAPRWTIESFVGTATVAGVDLFWGRSFDGKKRGADETRGKGE